MSALGKRIRSGDSGLLPVIVGLVAVFVFFRVKSPFFLQANNLINLIDYATLFIVFGVAELFILLLGEIDLSVGFNASVGAALVAEYAAPPHNFSWIVAVLIGVVVCSFIGLVQGLLITLLRLPAFIVTLAGYLGLQGVSLAIYDHVGGGGSATACCLASSTRTCRRHGRRSWLRLSSPSSRR
jgi:D-xylose transport system permease protein